MQQTCISVDLSSSRYAVHRVSKNNTALACYNFDIRLHQLIFIIFGRNVAKNVRSQTVRYFPTLPNYSASALPGETWKHKNRIFSLECCITIYTFLRVQPIAA